MAEVALLLRFRGLKLGHTPMLSAEDSKSWRADWKRSCSLCLDCRDRCAPADLELWPRFEDAEELCRACAIWPELMQGLTGEFVAEHQQLHEET
jgi:hypothetical protein